jgi:hypothetical protein
MRFDMAVEVIIHKRGSSSEIFVKGHRWTLLIYYYRSGNDAIDIMLLRGK